MIEQIQQPKISTEHLRAQWTVAFGFDPPRGLGHDLLARAVSHRRQEKADPAASRTLRTELRRWDERSAATKRRSSILKAGTQLIREWQGETYLVTALEEAFEFRGTQYASLSEIAGVITGTKWSGPKFFGLNANPSKLGASHG